MDSLSLDAIKPSDNLYRWITTIGALLLVGGYWMQEHNKPESREYLSDFQKRLSSIQEQFAIAEFNQKLAGTDSTSPDYIEAAREMARLDAVFSSLSEEAVNVTQVRELMISDGEAGTQMARLGLAFLILGVASWYLKFQRYEDVLVELQAEQSIREFLASGGIRKKKCLARIYHAFIIGMRWLAAKGRGLYLYLRTIKEQGP